VGGARVAAIRRGLCVLVGAECDDDDGIAERLLERLLGYRVIADSAGRMNLSLRDVDGAPLLVTQFTLAAASARIQRWPSSTTGR
jgi:D-tyrosyl-tRNA(Tyr) deacylase